MQPYLAAYRSRPFTYHYGGCAVPNDPSYAVYRGERYQYGNGLGDVLRGIGRFILPWFVDTASGFIKGFSSNLQSGQTLKNSAIGAAANTITDTADRAKSGLMAKMQGGGRKRKRRSSKKVARKRSKSTTKRKAHKKRVTHRRRQRKSNKSFSAQTLTNF